IDALGRVNWLLRGVTVPGEPPRAAEALTADGKEVGRITSSASDGEKAIALAYVRREQSDDGSQLMLGERAATVRKLPLA
ncbi:MAG: glycine cleavage T C-terminal barrel domain-containing protein, partial [Planctomycetota bacterium]